MKEKWKDIESFESYKISNLGKVKNKNTNNILKPIQNPRGYLSAFLYKGGKVHNLKIHRLVAKAFLPNPNNLPQVNHKDGNKSNNSITNLEWCSASDNIKHAFKNGLMSSNCKEKEEHKLHKLTQEEVDYIRKHYKSRDKEFSSYALGRKFGVSHTRILKIVKNEAWK